MNSTRTPNPTSDARSTRLDHDLFRLLFQANVTNTPTLDPVFAFVADLDACLEQIGDLEAVPRYIPHGLFPIIDVMAETSGERFVRDHQLTGPPLFRESLAFLLKVSWQRGYLMQRFRTLNHIPRPSEPVDPVAVMNRIIGLTGPDLSTEIEVFLQKAVTLCTEKKRLVRSLNAIQGLAPTVQPVLREWGAVTRSSYGWGLLIAKNEQEHTW
ncbi:MAG TPA: hypothetical protein VNO31_00420 [Umezawaea sp.]|nr:hypothetical protein [Umezawaea sp.]